MFNNYIIPEPQYQYCWACLWDKFPVSSLKCIIYLGSPFWLSSPFFLYFKLNSMITHNLEDWCLLIYAWCSLTKYEVRRERSCGISEREELQTFSWKQNPENHWCIYSIFRLAVGHWISLLSTFTVLVFPFGFSSLNTM